jgi:hypothetical protein
MRCPIGIDVEAEVSGASSGENLRLWAVRGIERGEWYLLRGRVVAVPHFRRATWDTSCGDQTSDVLRTCRVSLQVHRVKSDLSLSIRPL